MLSFEENEDFPEDDEESMDEEVPGDSKTSLFQRRIERATDTDDIPTLIQLINRRVDPVKYGLKADPPISIPNFIAIRQMVLADLFADQPERIYAKVKRRLKKPMAEVRASAEYERIKEAILESIDFVYSINGVSDAAKKFEPQLARSMVAEAFAGGEKGNKVLLDMGDRAAPKPQRQNTNKVVYILPNSHETQDELRRLAESVEIGGEDIDGSVLNVPRGIEG